MNIPFSEPFTDITTPPTGRFYRKLDHESKIPVLCVLVPMNLAVPVGDTHFFLDCIVHVRVASYRAREFRLGIVEYSEIIRGERGLPALRCALPAGAALLEMMEAWLNAMKDRIMHDLGEELDGKTK